ncbi:MIP/aquaporin family protein [Jiangella muralis]|uniref:MIP/aquaporin family protein n=1 Tax=Jiangella muralis TaxID=702383 RepID=UPI0009FAE692|nr:aquaporin [Jiangella muralis]
MDSLTRNVVAEAFGTFVLVVLTVTVIMIGPGLIPAALAYGLGTAALVSSLGHVSGGHFNPAVTLALLLGKKIDILAAVAYWIAQFLGAAAGALLVMLVSDREVVQAGTPAVADNIGVGGAITAEAVATFILVLAYLGSVVDRRAPASVYPMAIGLTVAAGFFAIAPLTGGALNPARGFGPAVIGGEWDAVATWLGGPLAGAVLAWALYQFVIAPGDAVAGRRGAESGHLPPPPGSSLLP